MPIQCRHRPLQRSGLHLLTHSELTCLIQFQMTRSRNMGKSSTHCLRTALVDPKRLIRCAGRRLHEQSPACIGLTQFWYSYGRADTELCQGDTNCVGNCRNLRVFRLCEETQFWAFSEQGLRKPLCSRGFIRCAGRRLHEQSPTAESLRCPRRWCESLHHGCISLQAWLSQVLLCQGDTNCVGTVRI